MKVLMLGWEFPPFITGGLGTACHGLTRALDQRGVRVTFVLPKAVKSEEAAHVELVSPQTYEEAFGVEPDLEGWDAELVPGEAPASGRTAGAPAARTPAFRHTRFLPVASAIVHPYQQSAGEGPVGGAAADAHTHTHTDPVAHTDAHTDADADAHTDADADAHTDADADAHTDTDAHADPDALPPPPLPPADEYDGDLIQQVRRYARFCLRAVRGLDFDVIHAHDWMTYPAGLWIARATGKPLVAHVHSTEFDRSGEHVNQRIYDIERRGMHGAIRVICVSQLTKNQIMLRYGVPDAHAEVVYNGVDLDTERVGLTGIRSKDKIVLYFGRITFQKGPEYFLRAAKRVLDVMKDVKFVVAGSGDMARHMIEMAASMGIGHQVLFTGFLRGDDIKRVFSLADLYVMPSISEPFGIAPLEAMGHDVPVLISKSSGVSEVLVHALKVDFWDVDDMANKIVAVLRHPPLRQTLRTHGAMEARRLTWEGAAAKCERIYREVAGEMANSRAV